MGADSDERAYLRQLRVEYEADAELLERLAFRCLGARVLLEGAPTEEDCAHIAWVLRYFGRGERHG